MMWTFLGVCSTREKFPLFQKHQVTAADCPSALEAADL